MVAAVTPLSTSMPQAQAPPSVTQWFLWSGGSQEDGKCLDGGGNTRVDHVGLVRDMYLCCWCQRVCYCSQEVCAGDREIVVCNDINNS